jgi:hypothetical protein
MVVIRAHDSGGGGFPVRLAASTTSQSSFLISIHLKAFSWSGRRETTDKNSKESLHVVSVPAARS